MADSMALQRAEYLISLLIKQLSEYTESNRLVIEATKLNLEFPRAFRVEVKVYEPATVARDGAGRVVSGVSLAMLNMEASAGPSKEQYWMANGTSESKREFREKYPEEYKKLSQGNYHCNRDLSCYAASENLSSHTSGTINLMDNDVDVSSEKLKESFDATAELLMAKIREVVEEARATSVIKDDMALFEGPSR